MGITATDWGTQISSNSRRWKLVHFTGSQYVFSPIAPPKKLAFLTSISIMFPTAYVVSKILLALRKKEYSHAFPRRKKCITAAPLPPVVKIRDFQTSTLAQFRYDATRIIFA